MAFYFTKGASKDRQSKKSFKHFRIRVNLHPSHFHWKTAKATLWGPLVKFSHRNTNTNDWSHIFAENKTNLTSVFRLAGTLQHSSTSKRLEIFYYLFESS